jgi:hypothetical protein
VTPVAASDGGVDERQRGEVGCMRRVQKERMGGEKGSDDIEVLLPFYTGAVGVGDRSMGWHMQ